MSKPNGILLVLALWLVFCGTASATQFYVNESGWWCDGGAFYGSGTPIQSAVTAADNGDSIYVYNGSYYENVDVNKRLTLEGEGADVVIVHTVSSSDQVIEVTVDYVSISGFTVTGTRGSSYKPAIYLNNVHHCNIYDNIASNSQFGIYLSSSSNNVLQNNTANSNLYYDSGCGIYLSSSSNNVLQNNTASDNCRGIYLYQSSNNTLESNTVNNCLGDGCGIALSGSSNNTLTNNIVYSNRYYGIYLYQSSNNTLESNIANSNNYFGEGYGIYLGSSSNNTLMNNTASLNGDDGIVLHSSSNYNTLTNNTMNSNYDCGIYMDSSSNDTLSTNTVNSNNRGIYLSDSDSNIITCNWMQNNTVRGFYLWESTGNDISYNNIIENGNYNTETDGWEWNFYNDQTDPVEAKHNYWGAGMNNSTIDASICDDEEGGWGEVEFYPFETDPVTCTPTPELHGDVNHDGKLSTADAVLALRMAVGSIDTDPAADVDSDGQVTSLDALMILQAAAGSIEIG